MSTEIHIGRSEHATHFTLVNTGCWPIENSEQHRNINVQCIFLIVLV
mgnify:CR=1 FL=1